MIIRYECDRSMARKKQIRKYCNRKCRGCICAITVDEWGRREHVPDLQDPCGNVTIRNINVMSGRERSFK